MTVRQLVEEVPAGRSLPDFEQKPVTMALAEGEARAGVGAAGGTPLPRFQHAQPPRSPSPSPATPHVPAWAPGRAEWVRGASLREASASRAREMLVWAQGEVVVVSSCPASGGCRRHPSNRSSPLGLLCPDTRCSLAPRLPAGLGQPFPGGPGEKCPAGCQHLSLQPSGIRKCDTLFP